MIRTTTLNEYRKFFQSDDIYIEHNNIKELESTIKDYVRTYCEEQKLPQISVKFIQLF